MVILSRLSVIRAIREHLQSETVASLQTSLCREPRNKLSWTAPTGTAFRNVLCAGHARRKHFTQMRRKRACFVKTNIEFWKTNRTLLFFRPFPQSVFRYRDILREYVLLSYKSNFPQKKEREREREKNKRNYSSLTYISIARLRGI